MGKERELKKTDLNECLFSLTDSFFLLLSKSNTSDTNLDQSMVDHLHTQTVCCMCGDVGFPDKLFSCKRCRFRFQHSYCSNYYNESCNDSVEICDWCRSERLNSGSSNSNASSKQGRRSEYVSGQRIKHHEEKSGGRNSGGAPSPRQTTRRYKLLKDVMC